jgi:hypothetical protein
MKQSECVREKRNVLWGGFGQLVYTGGGVILSFLVPEIQNNDIVFIYFKKYQKFPTFIAQR